MKKNNNNNYSDILKRLTQVFQDTKFYRTHAHWLSMVLLFLHFCVLFQSRTFTDSLTHVPCVPVHNFPEKSQTETESDTEGQVQLEVYDSIDCSVGELATFPANFCA